MTVTYIVILNVVKSPRQVAPSPPRYACHLSRFNGRVYTWKGKTVGLYVTVIYTPQKTTLPGDSSPKAQNDTLFL